MYDRCEGLDLLVREPFGRLHLAPVRNDACVTFLHTPGRYIKIHRLRDYHGLRPCPVQSEQLGTPRKIY